MPQARWWGGLFQHDFGERRRADADAVFGRLAGKGAAGWANAQFDL